MAHEDPTSPDAIPAPFRTWLYAAGTFIGVGVGPALLAAGQSVAAAVCAPIAGACVAVALGYRPTR